jgi:hypothetical protein
MSVTLNGEVFDVDRFRGMNHTRNVPAGFGRPAEPLFPDRIFWQMLKVINDNLEASGEAAESAAEALAYRDTAATHAATAQAARDQAVNAATSADYPYAPLTGGTGAAYTVNFTPDRTVSDGFVMRVNVSFDCELNPTMTVDANPPYPMLDAKRLLNDGVTHAGFAAKELLAGMTLELMYDARISAFLVQNAILAGTVANVSRAANYRTVNHTFALVNRGIEQHLEGNTSRTWTLASDSVPLTFPVDTDLPVFNSVFNASPTSTAELTLVTSASVIIRSGGREYPAGVGKKLILAPGEGGRLKKRAANTWLWIGSNADGWENV